MATVCFLLFAAAIPGAEGTALDPARIAEIAAWLSPHPTGFCQPANNRQAWQALLREHSFDQVISKAEGFLQKPVPELTDDLFLDYSRTGNRDRCQEVLFERSRRLTTLTLGEALENNGRFLKPLTELITALCAEKTWVYPAHDGKLDNFNGRIVEMDLRATAVAWELGEVDYVLGEKLSPETRTMLRENVSRRVLKPFREILEGRRREIHWMRATHNWNAVCLAGVTGAALALVDDPKERAEYVAAAEHYIGFFLKSFSADGYCSEGIGYWNYGFGHFLMLGEAVRQATAGKLDLLADPRALQPALYSVRAEILNGIYLTISDCHPGSRPDAQMVRYIRERFALDASSNSQSDFKRPLGALVPTLMFSFLPQSLPTIQHGTMAPESPLRSWFRDGGVLICRSMPDKPGFAVALKGGNNAENHNHNDVGSFSVVNASAMLVCDPGAEIYTARTFGSHRYDSKVLSSYGHAVPRIGGQLQRAGADARAVVLRSEFTDTADTLTLDLRSAYKVPALQKLERTFAFTRGKAATFVVRDVCVFSAPTTFETALITWGEWKRVSPDELQIRDDNGSVRVRIDTGGQPFEVQSEILDEDVPTKKKPLRLGIALKSPLESAQVSFTFRPEQSK